MQAPQWASTVVLVDADHLDQVAANLSAHFAAVLGRTIAKADLCHWLDCVALDSGITPGDNRIQVVFIHKKENTQLAHFTPADFTAELNAQAFKDHIAEFELLSYPVEDIVSFNDFFTQSLATIADAKEVKNVAVVADTAAYGDEVKRICADTDGKTFTLFSMQPLEAQAFVPQILGFSLLAALGIKADELK